MNARQEKNLKGGVERLVYVCGMMLPQDFSTQNVFEEVGFSQEYVASHFHFNADGMSFPKDPASLFYNALDPNSSTVEDALKTLVWFPMSFFGEKVTYAAWKDIPVTYAYTIDDNTTPTQYQYTMFGWAVKRGVTPKMVFMGRGHSPFLSEISYLVKLMQQGGTGEVEIPVAQDLGGAGIAVGS